MATKTKAKAKKVVKKAPSPIALAITALYDEQARLENEQYEIEDKLDNINEAIDALESL